MSVIETAKKYDRSIVAIATGIGVVLAAHLSLGGKIDELLSRSPVIQKIEAKISLNKDLQDQTNIFVKDKLASIDQKIDRLLRR